MQDEHQKTAPAATGVGTDLRFLLGPGIAVQVCSNADLGGSELDGLIALVAVQRDVLARASSHMPEHAFDAG